MFVKHLIGAFSFCRKRVFPNVQVTPFVEGKHSALFFCYNFSNLQLKIL